MLAFVLLGMGATAQEVPVGRKVIPSEVPATKVTTAAPAKVEQLDTGESLSFMGKKLWFEMRRRLNLTTAQEEADQKAAERAVRLKVGSVKVQQSAPKAVGTK